MLFNLFCYSFHFIYTQLVENPNNPALMYTNFFVGIKKIMMNWIKIKMLWRFVCINKTKSQTAKYLYSEIERFYEYQVICWLKYFLGVCTSSLLFIWFLYSTEFIGGFVCCNCKNCQHSFNFNVHYGFCWVGVLLDMTEIHY